MIEQRLEERELNYWLDDHTPFLDIQTLSYNAHQVSLHHSGVSCVMFFVAICAGFLPDPNGAYAYVVWLEMA